MNILVFDTVLNKSFISVLFNGEKTFKVIESDENNYHSAYLIRAIKDLSIKLSDLDYIAINKGVGSFTGIRVGLAIAKVLASELNKPVVELTTFEILSLAYKNKNIMTNAGRGSVFYTNEGIEPKIISFDDALKILNETEVKFITDNLNRHEKFIDFKDRFISYEAENIDLAPYELELAIKKAESGDYTPANKVKPLYIQTPPIFSRQG